MTFIHDCPNCGGHEDSSAIAEEAAEVTAASGLAAATLEGLATDIAYYEHLVAIDIPAWQYRRGDWFTIQLFQLMQKADVGNFNRLAAVFPVEARAFRYWQTGAWEQAEHEKRVSAIAEGNGETT